MGADDVGAAGIELNGNWEAPLQPLGALSWIGRDQAVFGRAVGLGKIGDDGRAFGDGEIAVLQHGNLLPGIYAGEFLALGLAGARLDRARRVVERKLVQRPQGAQRAAGADTP